MLATATLSALCFSAQLLPRTMPHGRVALAMSERGGEDPLLNQKYPWSSATDRRHTLFARL